VVKIQLYGGRQRPKPSLRSDIEFRARLVVHGFSNLDNHKTRVAASNHNIRKLPLWGIFKLQEVCLVAKKIYSKKVTQKNQNNYYEINIGTCILILIFLNFLF